MRNVLTLFQKQEYTDKETRLINLDGFIMNTRKILSKASGESYVIVGMDIDKYQELDQKYGEEIRLHFVTGMEKALMQSHLEILSFARIHSDRFILLAKKSPNLIEAVDAILNQVVSEQKLENYVGIVKFNFGGYEITNTQENVIDIIEKVRLAHRMSRKNMFQNIIWYNSGLEQIVEQEKYYNEHLLTSIENNEFSVHLQLQVHLHTERIFCAESLIRWIMPNGRIVYPDSFVPQFEKNGLIVHLDYHVLECVCKYLQSMLKQGKELFRIAINLSNETLLRKDFMERFLGTIEQYGIPYDYLAVEIQEVCFTEGEPSTLEHIKALYDAGVVIAMDAFASGYSSLRMLPELPIQIIKLDRQFLRANDRNEKMRIVIESMIALAHNLGIQVICEGVEHQKDISFLQELGCDCAQGYYIMRPISQEEFIPTLIDGGSALREKLFGIK